MTNSRHPTMAAPRIDVDLDMVLDVLSDPDCRAMLEAANDPRLAKELVDACDLPSSTVYRKLDRMTEAGLLKEQTRIDRGGHHASEYVSAVKSVSLVPDEDGTLNFDIEWKEDLFPEHAGHASFVAADD